MKALKALFYDPLESKGGLLAIVILISLCMLSFCFGRISAGDLNVITTTYVVMWTLMFTLSVDAALAIFDRLTSGWYRDNILHPEAVEFKSFADHPITRPLTNVKRMVLIFVCANKNLQDNTVLVICRVSLVCVAGLCCCGN